MYLAELMDKLKIAVHANKHKNVDILQLSSQICRKVKGQYNSLASYPNLISKYCVL